MANLLDALLTGRQRIQVEGTEMPIELATNFIGVTGADDPTNNRTNITISNPLGLIYAAARGAMRQ